MKVILFTLIALVWESCAAPDGVPAFKTSPVYKPNADSFVADQPQYPAENKGVAAVAVPVSTANSASSVDTHSFNADGFVDNYNGYNAYDQGYGIQSGFEGYLVPTGGYYSPSSSDSNPINYALSVLPHYSTVFAVIGKSITYLATGAAIVLLGAIAVFGLCTFTPICHIKLAGFNPLTIKEEVRSYMTPDNISATVNFLREAINKYQKMQPKR